MGAADTVEYLQGLEPIRGRCGEIYKLAELGRLENFTLHAKRMDKVVDMILKLIERDYGKTDQHSINDTLKKIPPHGRWRHFGEQNLQELIKNLSTCCGEGSIPKSILDLFVVAVLLDAGAGDKWKYKDVDGSVYSRSEGLAVATLRMFQDEQFGQSQPNRIVDSSKLKTLKEEEFKRSFQVSEDNPLLGVKGRV